MEKLSTITQTDINNGVLIRMLTSAGIPDVQEYVKTFHQETEERIIEKFEHSDLNKLDDDEQIVPPTDVQSWITSLRLRLDDPMQSPLSQQQQQRQEQQQLKESPIDIQSWITGLRPRLDDPIQPPVSQQQEQRQEQQRQKESPTDIQSWITGLRPRLDDPIQSPVSQQQQQQEQRQEQQRQKESPIDIQSWITGLRPRLDDPIQPPVSQQQQEHEQQQKQKPAPTDMRNWMQGLVPDNSNLSADTTTSETTTTSNDDSTVTGNLGTWLNDWSKNLTERPPPASLDNWLQGLIPNNMHEPIGKTTSSKGRLNNYLNAAQEVLSQHGYNVSSEITPPTNVDTKTGMFGNVKHMYFLWKTLDKNHDRKITVEDVQIMLQELGLGFLSKYVAQTLFEMVDTNHDGTLQFRDFVAFMSIIKQLIGAVGSVKTKT